MDNPAYHTTSTISNLTELRVEKLPVTGQTFYVQDAAQPGLSVRVSAGGVKAFVFTKHKHGRFTRITLGRVGAMRLDAARRAAQKLHGELAMNIDIRTKREETKNAATNDAKASAARNAQRPHHLYRHYDAKGALLYVGISLSAFVRTAQHRASSNWFRAANRITIETFPTRVAAVAAEKSAIKTENPLFNTRGSPSRHAKHRTKQRRSAGERWSGRSGRGGGGE